MPKFSVATIIAFSAAVLLNGGCSRVGHDAAATDSASKVAGSVVTTSGAAHEVEVIGTDYAFSMPDSVDAGRTAFTFTNKGKVDHEYNVVLLKEGVTLRQYIDALNKGEPGTPLRDGPLGVLFAGPGKTSVSVLSAEMLPGRTYAVQCIFTDSVKAPSHRELGMFKSFAVRNNAAPGIAAVPIDTIIGTDYAYTQFPRTLTPGWHHFVFINAGKQRHEINIAMLRPGASLKQLMEIATRDGDVDTLIDEALGVLHAESGSAPLGTLDFEVRPGREYVLVCTFSDTPKSPPHFALGMVTSMVATQ